MFPSDPKTLKLQPLTLAPLEGVTPLSSLRQPILQKSKEEDSSDDMDISLPRDPLPSLSDVLNESGKETGALDENEVLRLRLEYENGMDVTSVAIYVELDELHDLCSKMDRLHDGLKKFSSGHLSITQLQVVFSRLPLEMETLLGNLVRQSYKELDLGGPEFGKRALQAAPELLLHIRTRESEVSIDLTICQILRSFEKKAVLFYLCEIVYQHYRKHGNEESLKQLKALLGDQQWEAYKLFVEKHPGTFTSTSDEGYLRAKDRNRSLFQSFLSEKKSFYLDKSVYVELARLNVVTRISEEQWEEVFKEFPSINVPETVASPSGMIQFASSVYRTNLAQQRRLSFLTLPTNSSLPTEVIPMAIPQRLSEAIQRCFDVLVAIQTPASAHSSLKEEGIEKRKQGVFTVPRYLPRKVLRIVEKPQLIEPSPYSPEAWHAIVETVIHAEGLAIDVPAIFKIPQEERMGKDLPPSYVTMSTGAVDPIPFNFAFLQLSKRVQQRLANDLCRLIQLTGYEVNLKTLQIHEGRIVLPPQFIVPANRVHSAKGVLKTLLESSNFGHEDLPVLLRAASLSLEEMEEEAFETSDLHSLRRFFTIVRGTKPFVEKQEAFLELRRGMQDQLVTFLMSSSREEIIRDKWLKQLTSNPTLINRLTSKDGMDMLDQWEVRFGLIEALETLRLVKRVLLQMDQPNPAVMHMLMLTLRETMMGAHLLVLIAKESMGKETSLNLSQLANAFEGQNRKQTLDTIDRYCDLLREIKRGLSRKSMEVRLYAQAAQRFEDLPLLPVPKGSLRIEGLSSSPPPLRVLIVSYEIAKLGLKYGGLGEAVYGAAKGLSEKGYHVILLSPLFTGLPPTTLSKIAQGQTIPSQLYWGGERQSIVLHRIVEEGMDLLYAEEGAPLGGAVRGYFDVRSSREMYSDGRLAKPGRPWHGLKERMMYYSSLVAGHLELASAQKIEYDAIVVNDWHAAHAIEKLATARKSRWVSGKLPATVFVIHNNSYGCQGVYEPEDRDILELAGNQCSGVNVMKQGIAYADEVFTVSESFADEMQDERSGLGAGLTPWVRKAAHQGKFHGIISGSNPDLWNPATDRALTEWRDPQDPSTAINLSFSPQSENIAATKRGIRTQLFKALQQYYPEALVSLGCTSAQQFIDRPLLVYVGRYDSYQKGIDQFMSVLEAAHKKGALFITMGVGEDPAARRLLDRLQSKAQEYRCGWITRGDVTESSLTMQKGDPENGIPGLGSLIRASADYFVLPSSFEPCGLVQFEGWLYGVLAIGTQTGGLADTINGDIESDFFNGFTFKRLKNWESSEQSDLVETTVEKAIDFIKALSEEKRNALMARMMIQARQSSWTTSLDGVTPVDRYIEAIQKAIQAKQKRSLEPFDLLGVDLTPAPARDNYFGLNPKPDLHKRFGAHIEKNGVRFRVLAPAARDVKLVLVDEEGHETLHELIELSDGSWENLIPEAREGSVYEYEILNAQGKLTRKIDPFAFGFQMRPDYRCVVARDKPSFLWTDNEWIAGRRKFVEGRAPVNIYEVHLGTVKRSKGGDFLNYRELAVYLADYCTKLHYTHIELAGIFEHDDDVSMGYQVKGFFAPTSRHGTLEDFQYFVNYLHQKKIGVILDFIPFHFAKDQHGLRAFDGTALFEDTDPLHRTTLWDTLAFGFNSADVRKFLLSSADFFLSQCHVDGFRVDAVMFIESPAYSKHADISWNPGEDGTAVNVGGIKFLKDLTRLGRAYGHALMISENVDHPRIPYVDTLPVEERFGLGFHLRWNMKGRLATLSVLEDPKHIPVLVQTINQTEERSIFSYYGHDEARKMSIGGRVSRQPDSTDELMAKRVNLFNMLNACLPQHGRLTFMGTEFGATGRWDPRQSLKRDVLRKKLHRDILHHTELVNEFYLAHSAFWSTGQGNGNVNWVKTRGPEPVLVYERIDPATRSKYLVIHNLSQQTLAAPYRAVWRDVSQVAKLSEVRPLFSSNRADPGTVSVARTPGSGRPIGVEFSTGLPPYSSVVIEEIEETPASSSSSASSAKAPASSSSSASSASLKDLLQA